MAKKKEYFKLFSDCILVEGIKESLIYDLGRNTSYPIPNEFVSILNQLENQDLEEFKNNNGYNDDEVNGFISQFLEEELAFITKDLASFPKLDLTWDSPFLVTNSIVQINYCKKYDFFNVVKQLNQLGCQAVQLRIEYNAEIEVLSKYLSYFDGTRINSIDIIIPFNKDKTKSALFSLIVKKPRVRSIIIHSSKRDLVVSSDDILYNGRVIYTKKCIGKDVQEVIRKENFIFNISTFCESQNYNLGLNKKVCITEEGDIKNYLSHKKIFGNVNYDRISKIVAKKIFQEKWNISNNYIEKCKDCQYRFSCESNSDISVSENHRHKTELCDFDPYTNNWNE